MECIIIRCIQKNSLEWRAERLSFVRSFSLLQAIISKRRSSPMIRIGIRVRLFSVVRWSINKPISQLVNQSLLHQSSFHKNPIPIKDFTHWKTFWPNRWSLKDFTERSSGPIKNYSKSNSYIVATHVWLLD
jgi:hypothetical protein